MTKKDLIKKIAPMAISLIVLVVIAFSCSALSGNDKSANISDPDGIFATLGDIEVTNEEVYERLINQFGARELRTFIDTKLLTDGSVNYIELSLNDETFDVDEFIEKSKYGGYTYEDALTVFTADQIAELEASFEDRLVYNGYESMEDYVADLYLENARSLYTRDQLIEEDTIKVSDIVYKYENSFYDQAVVVGIRVDTLEEARNLLAAEGLTTNEDGSFAEDYANLEILMAYINIYNKVYSNRETLTLADAQAGTNEDIVFTYDEVVEESQDLAEFIFMVLDTENTVDESSLIEYKTYAAPISINAGAEGYYMAYKVSGDNINEMKTLLDMDAVEYEAIKDEPASSLTSTPVIEELINEVLYSRSNTSAYIQQQMSELYEQHEFTIHDKYLKFNFEASYGLTFDGKDSNSAAFSYVDAAGEKQEVTPTEFMLEMDNHVGSIVMNVLNGKIASTDQRYYDDVVTEEVKETTINEINTYKANFLGDAYISYGYSTSSMTWEEFIYAAFQHRSEQDLYDAMLLSNVIEQFRIDMYTATDIQDIYFELMYEEYQNAFELSAKQFLVFIDQNEDGQPDLNESHVWTAEQSALAEELTNMLRDRLTALNETEEVTLDSLTAIAAEYTNASYETDMNDENYSEWAKFKTKGLKVKVEDLSTVVNGTFDHLDAELKVMFDKMSDENLFNYISENNVSSEIGYHLLYSDAYVEKGDAYPDDENLVLPDRLDIEAFNSGEFDNLSTETLLFIAKYYTPVTNEYTENNELVLFDEARAEFGTVTFTNAAYSAQYEAIVATNKAAMERK